MISPTATTITAYPAYNRQIPREQPGFRPDATANSSSSPQKVSLQAPKTQSMNEPHKATEAAKSGECQTCKNRKYQDVSSDPGVSFKTPQSVAPEAAAAAVAGHEGEHVSRERSKAGTEGREVVYQNVSYSTGICPECGKVYVSGGETTTVTRAKPKAQEAGKGEALDAYV